MLKTRGRIKIYIELRDCLVELINLEVNHRLVG